MKIISTCLQYLVTSYLSGESDVLTLQESIQVRKERGTYCCCCKSGSVSCVLRLDRTGYVPGEDINMDAEIQNHSRKEVTTSYVTLQQVSRLKRMMVLLA